MIKHAADPKPDEQTIYPLHPQDAEPDFKDMYYSVELDSHTRNRNKRRDGIEKSLRDNSFKCRVRQWKFGGDDNAPKLRFFMISGIMHSCHFFAPLVKCMSLDEAFAGYQVEVYAFDEPGHGASGLPPNIKFGMLRMEDYVDVIRQIMDKLRTDEKVESFDYVGGHSMGGMLVMLLEESLAADNTTLREKYGTKGIILFAAAMPEEVHWNLAEGDALGLPVRLLAMLVPCITFSPLYLLHGNMSNEDFLKQYFAVVEKDKIKHENVVPGAPAGDAVSVLNSPEAYVVLSELGGLDFESGGVMQRPEIKEGLFSSYTLGISGYTKDVLFLPEEEEALCEYLSTNAEKRIYKTIDHDYAVHDDPYSFPCASFRLLADVVTLSNT